MRVPPSTVIREQLRRLLREGVEEEESTSGCSSPRASHAPDEKRITPLTFPAMTTRNRTLYKYWETACS